MEDLLEIRPAAAADIPAVAALWPAYADLAAQVHGELLLGYTGGRLEALAFLLPAAQEGERGVYVHTWLETPGMDPVCRALLVRYLDLYLTERGMAFLAAAQPWPALADFGYLPREGTCALEPWAGRLGDGQLPCCLRKTVPTPHPCGG